MKGKRTKSFSKTIPNVILSFGGCPLPPDLVVILAIAISESPDDRGSSFFDERPGRPFGELSKGLEISIFDICEYR